MQQKTNSPNPEPIKSNTCFWSDPVLVLTVPVVPGLACPCCLSLLFVTDFESSLQVRPEPGPNQDVRLPPRFEFRTEQEIYRETNRDGERDSIKRAPRAKYDERLPIKSVKAIRAAPAKTQDHKPKDPGTNSLTSHNEYVPRPWMPSKLLCATALVG